MKLRTLSIVVLVLLVLSAIAFYLQRPTSAPAADPRIGQALVSSDAIEKTASLKLSDQGKTVAIARQPDNSWKVTSYHDLPVDFSKLSRFMGDLGEAKLQRLVTSNPERISRLEFKDTRIELLDSAGKPVANVTLGKHAEAGGGRYVRFDDETKAYLANLNAWLDAESKNWANAQLLDVKPDDVAKVEISFPEGGVIVSRAKKEDPWKAENPPAGQQVKADRVSSLLNSVGNLRFSDTTDLNDPRAEAAKPHQRTVRLTTFDQKTVSVTLGRQPEEKKLKPSAVAAAQPAPATAEPAQKEPAVAAAASPEAVVEAPAAAESKPPAPEYDTIPAGPVFVSVSHSDPAAPVNTLMSKRAFQAWDYVFTGLPQKPDDLFEPMPAPVTPAPAVPIAPADPTSEQTAAPAAPPASPQK